MKNILIICGKLAEERTGGVQTRIINYSRNFSKFGINPIILSISDYKKQEEEKINEIITYKYPKNNSKINYLSFLLRTIKSNNIKGIHILEIPTGLHQQLSLLIGKILNIRTGVSFYGGEIWDAKESKNKKQLLKINLAMKFASRIAVNSNATKKLIQDKYYNKIQIVHPGVNSELLKYGFKKNFGGDFRILYVGRLIRRKGLDDIIKAVKLLSDSCKVSLSVIGGGNKERISEYKNLAKDLNLKNKVFFVGEIKDNEELARYYSNCDVFIMAPKIVNPTGGFESFGCVYLEAGIFKKPVIGTRHFGVKEAIIDGETGILVNENSPEEISNAVLKLIEDKELRKKLGKNNYKRTTEQFMDINSTEQLSKIFE